MVGLVVCRFDQFVELFFCYWQEYLDSLSYLLCGDGWHGSLQVSRQSGASSSNSYTKDASSSNSDTKDPNTSNHQNPVLSYHSLALLVPTPKSWSYCWHNKAFAQFILTAAKLCKRCQHFLALLVPIARDVNIPWLFWFQPQNPEAIVATIKHWGPTDPSDASRHNLHELYLS